MKEIWKTLRYHNEVYNNYEVSNLGNIRHKINKNNRIFQDAEDGYYRIVIHIGYVNGKKRHKTIKAHIAVASTFIDNPENKYTVNHIDGNKHNNYVGNLEWATQCEQEQHAMNILGYKPSYSKTMKNRFSKRVIQYNKDNKVVKIWDSLREIEYTLGFKHECISACARGKRKTAYGYYWKYAS